MQTNISLNIRLLLILVTAILLLNTTAIAEGSPKKKSTKTGTGDYGFYLKSGHRSPQWDEFIEPGFQSFANGNYATAFLFLKQAFDRGCRDGLVLFMMGIFKESQRAYPEAAELLAQAAIRIPKQYPGHHLAKGIHEHAGRALYQIDDFVRALPELQKALEHSPDNFMLLFMAGQLLRMNKRTQEAKVLFETALTAKPPAGLEQDSKHRLARELMILSFELKDYAACSSYADQVLAIDPGDAAALKYKQRVGQQIHLKQQMEKMERMLQ